MKIGFIGLGIMGESMCENIVKKHDDTVYCFDFIPAKVELLASKGAVPCKDSVELAEKSDVIISMVPKSEHSMSVYKTILPVLGAGKTCIDMSTIDPSVSVEISKMVKATGAAFMDAPVVKSKPLPASWASTWAATKPPARPCAPSSLTWARTSSGWVITARAWS